jgi:hypothetical protein
MKLGLQNYAVIIPIKLNYNTFNNKKVNSLEMYDTAQYYRILHKVIT